MIFVRFKEYFFDYFMDTADGESVTLNNSVLFYSLKREESIPIWDWNANYNRSENTEVIHYIISPHGQAMTQSLDYFIEEVELNA